MYAYEILYTYRERHNHECLFLTIFRFDPLFFFNYYGLFYGLFQKSHFLVNFDCRAMRFMALEAEDLPLQDSVGKF